MAAPGSVVASGGGNLSDFVKLGWVWFGNRGPKMCGRVRVSLRGVQSEKRNAFVGCLMSDFEPRCPISGSLFSSGMSNGRTFSSSCYSDGLMPEVSNDGALSAEQLSGLALSVEEKRLDDRTLKFLSGACYMPHPDKEKTGGEDAHFICGDEQVIGVADGVGGWADVGVNSGDYARQLMSNSVEAIRKVPGEDVDPLRVLEEAHAATNMMGSSTACIIALKNQDLHAINLGDSGFIVVRDGQAVFESPVQVHGFNCPYQLDRGTSGDLPCSGQVLKVPVEPGDVVVAGSDGLFDNVYSKEIASIVGDAMKEGMSPEATARKVAEFARARSLDRIYRTPFSVAAEKAGYIYFGGKLDDLTVVVSYVSGYSKY
ncbi:Probable protein phosphatase 2C 55 [Striga hermonthica]|uniref:Protein phosphatase n=1 Tax=Striga hermonthica TaxID=68872 RepID=A0A9N7NV41_STRHE|nr:Probable protein phosphatase 2C 55 [Striga hermonthica]